MSAVVLVSLAGVGAGLLGALLGLGGGVFLVPFMITVLQLPFNQARGISLITVVATSSAVAATSHSRDLVNLRLGLLLQVATALGGLSGSLASRFVSDRTLTLFFAALMVLIAAVMLSRLNTRNVSAAADADPGPLGGRLYDPELGRDVVYRVRRLPLALIVSFLGGNISSLLGIGGGVLMVPALNSWCGVPIRVAAATSALMIGVTATSALPLYWAQGEVTPHLAAGAVLGVLLGSTAGVLVVTRLKVRWLKLMTIVVLLGVAVVMLARFR
jgi:hypothetical protein